MAEHPPGPPSIPRCRECRRIVGYQGHAPDCSIGQEQKVHFGNVTAVEVALKDAIARRRNDREFMARLRTRLEADSAILDALADATNVYPKPHYFAENPTDRDAS